MVPALILFAVTYVLMLVFSKYRPYIALGGNRTPNGASASIAGIGIPFTLAAIIPAYVYIWLIFGV